MGMKLAFIGLGVMGFPMAGHLATAGHDVTVYNRTTARARSWVKKYGGKMAKTPAEAARGMEIVFACMGNDDDVRSVATAKDGIFQGIEKGAIFVDHTTASANLARELDAAAKEKGCQFLDAPVSGGQAGAENGVLTVMVGGRKSTFRKVEPVIGAYAREAQLLGAAGAGQLTKMVNQICIAELVQGLAEGHELRPAGGPRWGPGSRRHLQGRRPVVADGKPRTHDVAQQVQLRLCRRMDAQGSFHLFGGVPAQWRATARRGARRPVLCSSAGTGRKSLGHVQPDEIADPPVIR